jgi:hypothetical protein
MIRSSSSTCSRNGSRAWASPVMTATQPSCGMTLSLGAAMNATIACWKVLLPGNFEHPNLTVALLPLLRTYQEHYCGAVIPVAMAVTITLYRRNRFPGHSILSSVQSKTRPPEFFIISVIEISFPACKILAEGLPGRQRIHPKG